jgi:hypothetical protein
VPNKNILLLEPAYNNKYPPIGLMKIAAYHRQKNDNVVFVKGEDKAVEDKTWDRIFITTLFTFEFENIKRTINYAINLADGQTNKIFVGGIAASLMHSHFLKQSDWRGIRFIKGLLNKSPSESLELDDFEEEFYADDLSGQSIENLVPDYTILDQIDYQYPVHDAYFLYGTRGCIRKCKFCGVPKLEGDMFDMPDISDMVHEIIDQHGEKKDLIMMDNNVVASAKFNDIISQAIDLGFEKGATITRNGQTLKRRVDFNQGVDARILVKSDNYLKSIGKLCIDPLRIAFDHLGVKKHYDKSVRMASEFGIEKISNYMLYNFMDTPEDLFARMNLNVQLKEELGIDIFSFPMRYQPTNLPHRRHVGPKWNAYYLRSMQIVLQATHGIVSGSPQFFRHAFGHNVDEFFEILDMPHRFIFYRSWYESGGGKAELEEYKKIRAKLSDSEADELRNYLSDNLYPVLNDDGKVTKPAMDINTFNKDIEKYKNSKIREILTFYKKMRSKENKQLSVMVKENKEIEEVKRAFTEETLVEDAALVDSLMSPILDPDQPINATA